MKHNKEHDLKQNYFDSYENTLNQLWGTPYSSFKVATPFGQTHVIASGAEEAPPLVLLHAHEFSSTMWYPNVSELAKHFRVYAVDIIGDRNLTEVTRFPDSQEEYAQWLEEVLNALNITEADITGISYGALLTLNFAIRRPDRIRRAFIMSPSMGLTGVNVKYIGKIIFNSLISTRPKFVAKLFNWTFENRYIPQKPFFNQIVAGALWKTQHAHVKKGKRVWPYIFKDEELSSIRCHVYLLVGENDIIQNAANALERAKTCLSSVTTEMVSGGHFINLEQSELVNSKIIRFMLPEISLAAGEE